MNYNEKETVYFGETRPELVPFYKDVEGKWLDIGCGNGNFAKDISIINKNIEVWGIEPHTNLSVDNTKTFTKFYKLEINDALSELPNKTFDIISFNDVLEHLLNPNEILSACKEKLQNGGKIYASIPNFLFFPSIFEIITQQDFKYRESGILDNTHIRFFTRKSIIRLFEDSGYTVELLEPINPKSFEYLWLYKILNAFTFRKLLDWRYMQFFIMAKPKK